MQTTKKNIAFLIYATSFNTSINDANKKNSNQCNEFKDLFEKKNVDILPEH